MVVVQQLPVLYAVLFCSMSCKYVVPSLVYAVRFKVQKTLYSGFMLYLFLMYFNFSRGNGVGGNFTTDRYKNHLWLK